MNLNPKRGLSDLEKLEFYKKVFDDGLTIGEMMIVRNKVKRLSSMLIERDILLECIDECIVDKEVNPDRLTKEQCLKAYNSRVGNRCYKSCKQANTDVCLKCQDNLHVLYRLIEEHFKESEE